MRSGSKILLVSDAALPSPRSTQMSSWSDHSAYGSRMTVPRIGCRSGLDDWRAETRRQNRQRRRGDSADGRYRGDQDTRNRRPGKPEAWARRPQPPTFTIGTGSLPSPGEQQHPPAQPGLPAACLVRALEQPRYGMLRLLLDLPQVIFTAETLGIYLVDILGAGRARGKPSVLGNHLDATERNAVARSS